MAVNRLAADMMKIADILGYSINTLDISNIGIENYKDSKSKSSDNMTIMEVVYDREMDIEFNKVEFQIGRIFNAFMYGEQSGFWRTIILERFEPQTQIDFMLLVSFIYMRLADIDNKEARIAEAMGTIAATLCKYMN